MELVIGIDIGGTNFRIGAVDRNGTVNSFSKKPSAPLAEGDAIEILYNEIKAYIEKFGKENIRAVTIGIPSIVSKDKKTVYSTPNLKGMDNVNIADPLSEKLGLSVLVDRDVNFLLMNDIKNLGLPAKGITAGFYIGTGFGNAICIDGNFLTGKNGAAGELGHIPLYGIDEKCTCGNIGCSETRCSGKRLEQLVNEHFPETKIENIFKEKGDDPIIDDFVRSLAIPIATEINILDPDYIVIAGGVVIMEDFPKERLEEAVHFYARKPYPEKNLDIRFTSHTQKSGVIGGACYAFQKMYP